MSELAVLHLTRDLPPGGQGGVSVAVAAFREAIGAVGARQAVLSFDGWRPLRSPELVHAAPVRATPDALGPIWRLAAPGALTAAMATAGAWLEAAHAAGCRTWVLLHADLLAEPALALARSHGAGFAVYAHVLQGEQRRIHGLAEATASERAQGEALTAADLVFAPSRWAAARLGVLADAPIVVWPPPLAARAFEEAGTVRVAGEPRLLYLGRFDAIKGFDVLLEALPSVMAAFPGLRPVLAGGLPHSSKGERRWRRRIDAALGAGRVELPGFLDHGAALAAIAAADVVVVPSRLETFGLVAEEAMAAGKCVVAAAAGALGERLRDGEDSLVVPAGDAGATAAALRLALGDGGLRGRLGACARAAGLERRTAAWVPEDLTKA
ncbi:MAG: hypothetical protein RIT45_1423 [Pseudomonadota bacterium]|jgi:glycosyltransferase involved in cell wall biosynthesis